MKILQIIGNLDYGGAERLVVDFHKEFCRLNLKSNVYVFSKVGFQLEREIKENSLHWSSSKGLSTYNSLIYFIRLLRFIRTERVDIILVHLFPAFYVVALIKLFLPRRIAIIYVEHNTSNRRMRISGLRKVERWVYRRYNGVICISDAVKKALGPYVSNEEKLKVILNGIEVKRYVGVKGIPKSSIHETLSTEDIVIINVAGFRPQKDQRTIIDSIEVLPEEFKLVLVGEGPTREEIETYVKHKNLKERVIFLGLRNDVSVLLRSVDMAVISSHWEGFGLFAVEAMASRTPLLASKVAGLAEIVNGGATFFEVGDFNGLAKEILRIHTDKHFAETKLKIGQELAKKYTIEKTVKEYVKMFKEINRFL